MWQTAAAELLEWFPCWQRDGLAPLNQIAGGVDALLQQPADRLPDEPRAWLQTVRAACLTCIDRWNLPVSQAEGPGLFEQVRVWRHNGIAPLTLVTGYVDLLLEAPADTLPDELQAELRTIRRACLDAIDRWTLWTSYLELRHDQHPPRWEPTHLSEVVSYALTDRRLHDVKADWPDDLPLIGDNGWLAAAFLHLFNPLDQSVGHPSTVKVSLGDRSSVSIQVVYTGTGASIISHPGTPLSVVDLIVQLYGSRMEIQPSEAGTRIRFALPVEPAQSP
jgi:hypothetical protein